MLAVVAWACLTPLTPSHHSCTAGLRDAHWAAACGSRPEPALLRPLTPSTALQLGPGRTYDKAERGADPSPQRQLAPFALSRALAAAERRCAVLPDDWYLFLSIPPSSTTRAGAFQGSTSTCHGARAAVSAWQR